MLDLLSRFVQFRPFGFLVVSGRKIEAEPVAPQAGKHIKVNMKNFLIGCLAIGQERVYALTLYIAVTQCRCHSLRNSDI
jgi:hypothetical protein